MRHRETALLRQLEAMRNQMVPVQKELEQVRGAIRAMVDMPIAPTGHYASSNAVLHHKRQANPEVQSLTFKQLTVKALQEHYGNGATASQLLDFFKHKWGRNDVVRTSLSPQLTRLKREGKIRLEGKVWHLVQNENEPRGENAGGSDAPSASVSGTLEGLGLTQTLPTS